MSKSVKITVLIIGLIYLAFHLATLAYNPLPWYDETYFASISLNWQNHGSFFPMIAYHAKVLKEDFAYGPIYFILTGLSFKLFGFGILQFRIINFLFGLLLILVFSSILRLYKTNTTIVLIIAVVFLFDPFLNLALHEGRMDLVTLTFMLISALLLLGSLESGKLKNRELILSGIFAVTALLTTPRIGFIYLALCIVFLIWLIKNFTFQNFMQATLWVLPVIIIYSAWMFYAFGGVKELLAFYRELSKEEAAGYVGFLKPIYFIPKHEWLLIMVAIISLLYKLLLEEIKMNYFYIFSLLSIIIFYLIVVDVGPYSILIIPFYYFIITDTAESFKSFSFKKAQGPFLYLVSILLLFNLAFFLLKGMQIIGSLEQRDYQPADSFIRNYIPRGSKVVGDPLYFYSVIKAGSDFQYFNKYGTDEEREQKHREEYDYDYLIITDQSRKREPETILIYLTKAKFRKVGRFQKKPSVFSNKLSEMGVVSAVEDSGYNADLYVRLKFDETLPTAMIGNSK